MRELCVAKMSDRATAQAWVLLATRLLGLCFHPDTPAVEYENLRTGRPLFEEAEAATFDKLRARAFELLGTEAYEIGLSEQFACE